MALKLSEANIPTKVIPDADVFAFMPHVNKVIIGTHTVMADGGYVYISLMCSLSTRFTSLGV